MRSSTSVTWSIVFSCLLIASVNGSAIPIWEMLTYEEKLGRLLYIFIHLVGEYCKTSDIPDCRRVLSLYGTSNLLNNDEASLDLLDPYQRDGHIYVWQAALKSSFKTPDSVGKIGTRVLEEALFGLGDLRDEPQPTTKILLAPRPHIR